MVFYAMMDLIKWLVKRVSTKSPDEKAKDLANKLEDLYDKERALLHEIRNAIQLFEIRYHETQKRVIDRLSDIVDDIRSHREDKR